MEYGGTAHNRSVYASPPVGGSGYSRNVIRHPIKTYCCEEVLDGCEGKYLVLGCDTNGNPLEIVYEEFGENGMCVFHVMPCQEKYLSYFIRKGEK